jgi:oligopeptide transport system substrate-binding protein
MQVIPGATTPACPSCHGGQDHFDNSRESGQMILMNFRRAVLGAGLAAVLTGGLAGALQAQDVLRVGNMGEPATLDPHHVAGVWEDRIIGDMFMGLTTEGPDASVVPGAAESWTVSEDGRTYTFKLRDHSWSDGVAVSADDFVFALRRILAPETAAKYASLLYPIRNAEELNSAKMTGMENLGVRAVDAKTLEITLKAPTPYFIEQLTHYTAFPVPRHLVEKFGDDWVKKEHIASNGAYVLDEWVPNTHVRLTKNPDFFDAKNVAIEKVEFYPTEDRGAVQKRFRAGEIDIAKDFASEQFDFLKKELPEEIQVAPELGIYYYPINTNKPPFDDVRVRQALSLVIDREAITDKVLTTGEVPAYSFVPPGTGNYGNPAYVDWIETSYAERVAKAKALLADAGYGPDKPLKFTLSYNTSENHKRIAIAVASMWKKELGVQIELFNQEITPHYDNLEQNNFDVARAAWVADYNDAQNFLYLLETRTGRQNYGRWSNAEFDKLMDQASTTTDMDTRSTLLRQAEAIAMEEQPVIPIYYYVSKNLVSSKVKGWIPNVRNVQRTRYLSLQ